MMSKDERMQDGGGKMSLFTNERVQEGGGAAGAETLLRIGGRPNDRQKQFFASRARYTAYGGARGGGKSWALRRKLIGLCLAYPG
ncbi:MAG: hypothetical protein IIU88_00275, partial [Clostridia bacterium]|nr:hypothetical protein [Clostridia bacterium]